jgi:hypothetical protein
MGETPYVAAIPHLVLDYFDTKIVMTRLRETWTAGARFHQIHLDIKIVGRYNREKSVPEAD